MRRIARMEIFNNPDFKSASDDLMQMASLVETAEKIERGECGLDEDDLIEEIVNFIGA
jgi:hypothetical protein